MADIHAPIRAGTDIAFLGGLINYVINSERWNTDPFFQEYVVNYTNAATIVSEEFKDTEELDGVFSGLMEYTAAASRSGRTTRFVGSTTTRRWQYAAATEPASGAAASTPPRPGAAAAADPRPARRSRGSRRRPPRRAPPAAAAAAALRRARALAAQAPAAAGRDAPAPALRVPDRQAALRRYTPEMVEQVTGCPQDIFLKVAETILANSGPRPDHGVRATPWPGPSTPTASQMIGCCAMLQLLLGNIGRPGGGIMALRGHASIQGSTDMPDALPLDPRLHGRIPRR